MDSYVLDTAEQQWSHCTSFLFDYDLLDTFHRPMRNPTLAAAARKKSGWRRMSAQSKLPTFAGMESE